MDFLRRDEVPGVDLVGIFPGTKVGRDIFRDPDEEGDEREGENQRHAPFFFGHGEVDRCAPKEEDDEERERPADIDTEAVEEEVEVDGDAQRDAEPVGRILFQASFQDSPSLGEVAGDRGIHEAAIERHSGYFEKGVFRIAP